MPPKRSTRAKPNGNVQVEIPSTQVNGSAHPTSMLHALSHIPPALPHAEEDDDLTPPPELSPVKPVTSKQKGKANGKGKSKAEPVETEDMDSAELAAKRKEIEHKAVEEITEEIQGKRRKTRVSYTETAPDVEEGEEELDTRPAKKGKKTPQKVKDEYDPDHEVEATEEEPAPVTPKKGGKKKAVKGEEDGEAGEEGEEKTPKEKKPRKPTPKKSRLAIINDEPDYDEDGNEIVKKKRKPKVYAKVEYVIPDVPKKTTNFRGKPSSFLLVVSG